MHVSSAFEFARTEDNGTISAKVLPFNKTGNNGWGKFSFAPGSVYWPENVSNVKLLIDHKNSMTTLAGHAVRIVEKPDGIYAEFTLNDSEAGKLVRELIDSGSADAFSIGVQMDPDGLAYNAEESTFRVSANAFMYEVSAIPVPAFDDARLVQSFSAPTAESTATPETPAVATFNREETPIVENTTPDSATFAATVADGMKAGMEAIAAQNAEFARTVTEALTALASPAPAATPVLESVKESSPYSFTGYGASFVRDAWNARNALKAEEREAAQHRVEKFQRMVEESAESQTFTTGTTGNLSELVPTTNRQDMYVPNLSYTRPLFDAVSKGPLADATPFKLPKFSSATGLAATGTEGVNPSGGTIDLTDQTITPTSVVGLFQMTREIVMGSNPALDVIAAAEMQRAYEEEIETRIAALFNGITASTLGATGSVDGDGVDLVQALKLQLATAHFRRGGNRLDRLVSEQDAYVAAANAVDTNNRPLLPYLGVSNSDGTVASGLAGLNLAGYPMLPAWALTQYSFLFASASVWTWNSPVQGFRFEEKNGPAVIDLAIFGLNANAVLRSSDVVRVAYTAA